MKGNTLLILLCAILWGCGNHETDPVHAEVTEATVKLAREGGVETRLNLRISNSGAQELQFGRVGVRYFVDGVELPATTTGNGTGPTIISVGKSIDVPIPVEDSRFASGSKKQIVVSLLSGEAGQVAVHQPITIQVPADSNAMYNVAALYAAGQGGLPKDERKAAELYQKAIDVDQNVDALFNLGTMYFNGQGGLTKNEQMAEDLFQKAADRGDAGARERLQQLRGAK